MWVGGVGGKGKGGQCVDLVLTVDLLFISNIDLC